MHGCRSQFTYANGAVRSIHQGSSTDRAMTVCLSFHLPRAWHGSQASSLVTFRTRRSVLSGRVCVSRVDRSCPDSPPLSLPSLSPDVLQPVKLGVPTGVTGTKLRLSAKCVRHWQVLIIFGYGNKFYITVQTAGVGPGLPGFNTLEPTGRGTGHGAEGEPPGVGDSMRPQSRPATGAVVSRARN